MHLNELEQLNEAYTKQVSELENQISRLQVCATLFRLYNAVNAYIFFNCFPYGI